MVELAQGLELENVACMLCGHDESLPAGSVEFGDAVLAYRICCDCGLKYMSPRPTRRWLEELYSNPFWTSRLSSRNWRRGKTHLLPWQWHRRGLSGRLLAGRQRLASFLPMLRTHAPLSPGSRVLDVGCAFGVMLAGIRDEFGSDIYGIEPGAVARAYAENEYQVTMIGTTAEDLAKLDEYKDFFHLITFSNALENMLEPRDILKSCYKLLRDDGRLFIDTPNFFYFDSMNPYHPYIFSEDTLNELLAQSGFAPSAVIVEPSASQRTSPLKIKPYRRERFLTIFSRKGRPDKRIRMPVDAQGLLAEQAASLALLRQRLKLYKLTPKGLWRTIVRVK